MEERRSGSVKEGNFYRYPVQIGWYCSNGHKMYFDDKDNPSKETHERDQGDNPAQD